LFIVDIDANEGFCIISAMNRSHAVSEYGPIKFPPVYPALQVQALDAVQALHDCPVFTGHAVHGADPVVVLNVPAAHAVHAIPFGPVKPISQVHAWMVWLEAGDME
jgi:hypothetical protein